MRTLWAPLLLLLVICNIASADITTLKDIKSIYIETDFSKKNGEAVTAEEQKKIFKLFGEVLKDFGFTIVTDAAESDAITKMKLDGLEDKGFYGWQTWGGMKVDFLSPKSKQTMFSINMTKPVLDGYYPVANLPTLWVAEILKIKLKAMNDDKKSTIQVDSDGQVVNVFLKNAMEKGKLLKPQMALKEFKNVYIEAYNAKDLFPESAIPLPKDKDYNRVVKKFKEKGVNVVDDIGNADIIYRLKFHPTSSKGVATIDTTWVEFVLPGNNFVIIFTTIPNNSGLFDIPIDDVVEKTINLVKDETLYKIVTTPQPKESEKIASLPVKYEKDKKGEKAKKDSSSENFEHYVPKKFVVLSNETGAKGESIYNIKNARLRIAVLFYRSYYPDVERDFPLENENIDDVYLNIKKHQFEKENQDVFSRFGYSISKNLLGDFIISGTKGSGGLKENVIYPEDLEDLESDMHTFILRLLMENVCSIIDLTPVKEQFDSAKLSDLISENRVVSNVDAFFIFDYQLYSRFMVKDEFNNREGMGYGLMCSYKILLIDAKTLKVLFNDTDKVKAFVSSTGVSASGSTSFNAPIEWLREIGKNKIGIINREWLKKGFMEDFKIYDTIYVSNFKQTKRVPSTYSVAARLKSNFDQLKEYPEFVE